MDKIKEVLIGILLIVLIVIIPVGVFTNFFNFIADAIKWIFFFDNAETGLPIWTEMFVKGIIEGLVLLIAGYAGIKEKNPLVSIITIIIGFMACIIIYWLAKYILIVLGILLGLIIVYVCYLIISRQKNKTNDEGDVIND